MERHLTIGISGHVDHGKTTLVKALTGVDTDRMKEEKIRGLSIEFGIAPLKLPTGGTVSLIDVPGHTDFMKNTIRGLSAVDSAILVVAANDGVMPQTREHFEILRLLETETGFVVLTKADLVDQETQELAALEVYDLVSGSFLEKSPVIPFHGINGKGRDEVMAAIETLVSKTKGRKDSRRPFRLFIDQIRTFPGIGTVVSGTVLSGEVHRGDQLQILPSGQIGRVRSLQAHHSEIETAIAGDRVGINLQGIAANDILRGMVLAEPGTLQATRLLNVALRVSNLAKQSVRTGQRIKLYLGTAVLGALVVIMEGEEILPGNAGFAQLRLTDSIGAIINDRFVATPMNSSIIIGGGRILEATPVKYRRAWSSRTVPLLKALQSGDLIQIVKAIVAARPEKPLTPEELSHSAGFDDDCFEKILNDQVSKRCLVRIGPQAYISAEYYYRIKNEIVPFVQRFLQGNTSVNQVQAETIGEMLPQKIDTSALTCLLKELVQEGRLTEVQGGLAIPSLFRERISARSQVMQQVLATVEGVGVNPVSAATVWESHQDQEKTDVKKVLDQLSSQKKIIRLGNGRYVSRKGLEEIKSRIGKYIQTHGAIKLSDCGEALGVGRTVGFYILEYLDRAGFTLRRGDERVLK